MKIIQITLHERPFKAAVVVWDELNTGDPQRTFTCDNRAELERIVQQHIATDETAVVYQNPS